MQSSPCSTARALPVLDPDIHEYGLGEERITVISPPEEEPNEDTIMHLIQDDQLISELHAYTMPPDHYYDRLAELWSEWWPEADPELLEHMMSVLIAFDTATWFAMSFGIAKVA